jgi:hypothetical protein
MAELTITQWAQAEGISRQAAHKRIRSGKVRLTSRGLIDPDQAAVDWERNRDCLQAQRGAPTVQAREPRRPGAPTAAPAAAASSAAAAPADAARSQGGLEIGAIALDERTTSLADAQRISAVLKALREKREHEIAEGKWLEASAVRLATEQRARTERDALLNMPSQEAPDLAARLGIDERLVHSELDLLVRKYLAQRGQITTN